MAAMAVTVNPVPGVSAQLKLEKGVLEPLLRVTLYIVCPPAVTWFCSLDLNTTKAPSGTTGSVSV